MSVLDSFRLDGKLALVTGCNRGLGQAIAIGLAEAGADIVGVSRSLNPEESETKRAIESLGRRFRGFRCDFNDRGAVRSFAATVIAEFPVIDILVNNAGTIRRKPAAEHPEEFWDEVINTNLHAAWILTQAVGSRMVERGSGKIIFVASLLTFQGGITVPGYAASKGAVGQLTKALANEWAGRGVHVNAIAPGYMATDNTEALRADPDRSSAILSRIPAGRWGEAADMQGAAVFLASTASDYVNGTIITVDGGWMGR